MWYDDPIFKQFESIIDELSVSESNGHFQFLIYEELLESRKLPLNMTAQELLHAVHMARQKHAKDTIKRHAEGLKQQLAAIQTEITLKERALKTAGSAWRRNILEADIAVLRVSEAHAQQGLATLDYATAELPLCGSASLPPTPTTGEAL